VNFVLYFGGPPEKRIALDGEDMEWILNSLRLMQEQQGSLAAQFSEHTLELGPAAASPTSTGVATANLFLEQHECVTNLRERLVGLCGRDLTDTGL
jgi:hypothetical protein